MKKKYLIITITVVIIAALGLIIATTLNNTPEVKTEKQLYTCGMHPDIIEDHPGDCPICGMKLVPVKNSASRKKSIRSTKNSILARPYGCK